MLIGSIEDKSSVVTASGVIIGSACLKRLRPEAADAVSGPYVRRRRYIPWLAAASVLLFVAAILLT